MVTGEAAVGEGGMREAAAVAVREGEAEEAAAAEGDETNSRTPTAGHGKEIGGSIPTVGRLLWWPPPHCSGSSAVAVLVNYKVHLLVKCEGEFDPLISGPNVSGHFGSSFAFLF